VVLDVIWADLALKTTWSLNRYTNTVVSIIVSSMVSAAAATIVVYRDVGVHECMLAQWLKA
jgi:hypothetical protein